MPELKASLTVSTPHATSISSLTDRKQWALPVCFEKLVAHIEAFEATLPAITALHEYLIARDPTVPPEVVEMIEEAVVAPEGERHLAIWSRLKKCWEGKCVLEDDHPIPADQDGCPCYDCAREECKSMSHPLNLNGHVCLAKPHRCYLNRSKPNRDCTIGATRETICEQNGYEFEDGFSNYGPLSEMEILLERNFGIGIWVSQTLSKVNKRAALAYLTRPSYDLMREKWEFPESPLSSESGFGVPVHLSGAPSAESLRRFPRALRILHLELFVHQHVEDLSVAQGGEEVSEGEGEVPSAGGQSARSGKGPKKAEIWPQLTLLMKSSSENDD
jgi:hypothetical protein